MHRAMLLEPQKNHDPIILGRNGRPCGAELEPSSTSTASSGNTAREALTIRSISTIVSSLFDAAAVISCNASRDVTNQDEKETNTLNSVAVIPGDDSAVIRWPFRTFYWAMRRQPAKAAAQELAKLRSDRTWKRHVPPDYPIQASKATLASCLCLRSEAPREETVTWNLRAVGRSRRSFTGLPGLDRASQTLSPSL
ncbi:hypothetical protein CSOJ01_04563 [Colletotrichum sojae]|uniref:Uncharacterized protein n=1 Tax=Colletotrichum sojae TaxID=2175907 RepID=A0A8H6MZ41_9PEZI|nr:hypothetical protein CSOJ01_04563 [Colletotrichum sojae]